MIPFLIVNFITIIGAVIGVILLIFKLNDKTNDDGSSGDVDSTPMPDENDDMRMSKTLYTAIAIALIAISVHSWIVIYALYKHDSSFENKIDDAVKAAISNIPPLQNVASVDDGIRFTYQ